MFVRNVESMNSLQAHYSMQADLALANENYKDALDHVLDHSTIQHRIGAGIRHEQHIDLRDNRQKKVNEFALTHKGFGMNSGSSLTAMQAAAGCAGAILATANPAYAAYAALQPASMAFGGLKSLLDEGNRGNQTLMQSHIDDIKRFQEDLRGEDQRSQSAIAEAINMKKQAASADHEAMRQLSQ